MQIDLGHFAGQAVLPPSDSGFTESAVPAGLPVQLLPEDASIIERSFSGRNAGRSGRELIGGELK